MNRYDTIVVGKTKNKKEIAYRVKEGAALYTICFIGGGVVPSSLNGSYTDVGQVKQAIHTYLNRGQFLPEDKAEKDYKKSVNASKRRDNTLKVKEA